MAKTPADPRVIAISGTDPVLVIEKVEEVLQLAGIDISDTFDHVEVDAIETDAPTILQSVTTIPFLSSKRSVVVRRANRLKESDVESLSAALPSLPQTGLLVLVFESTDDEAKGASLKAAAKKAGELIEVRSPKREEIIREVEKRAKAAGLTFQGRAAHELVEMVGDDITETVSELGKLVPACAKNGKIGSKDVREIVVPSREYRVFVLLDEVCMGRLGPALTQLDRLLSSNSKVEEAAMRHLLPQMHKQLLMVYQARALADERAPMNSPTFLHPGYSLADRTDFQRNKASGFARKLSLPTISRLLRLVLETDMRLKGQLAQANPRESLERMLAEMCVVAT